MASWGVEFNDKIMGEINEGAIDGLKEAVTDLSEKSQKLCPKNRGYNGGLVSTAETDIDPEALSMTMRYKAPHAWLQHEKIQFKHKPGEQAKYVEQPLNENGPRYLEMVAAAIRRRLSR